MDPAIKEILDNYVPLYELKMQSKIEGVDIGLKLAVAENKQDYLAEQTRHRIIAQK